MNNIIQKFIKRGYVAVVDLQYGRLGLLLVPNLLLVMFLQYLLLNTSGTSLVCLFTALLMGIALWPNALTVTTMLLGIYRSLGREKQAQDIECDTGLKTAVLFPCFEEDIGMVLQRVSVMRNDLNKQLQRRNRADQFAFFILSDTQNPELVCREQDIFQRWAQEHDLVGPTVHYRRRLENTCKKVGNIDEWVHSCGGTYDLMSILDADSTVTGNWFLRAIVEFAHNPRLALLQSMIYVAEGPNAYSRLAAFNSRLCGKIYARGLALWSGSNAPYWGHNATLRISAYTQDGHLPRFKNGSTYLSHDVVEASQLSAAGWDIRLLEDEQESWEQCPLDPCAQAQREQRWCEGNFQHIHLLLSRKITHTSRLHIANGILGYLSAPFGLIALLLLGFHYSDNKLGLHTSQIEELLVCIACLLVVPNILGLICSTVEHISANCTKNVLMTLLVCCISILSLPSTLLGGSLIVFNALLGSGCWKPQQREKSTIKFLPSILWSIPNAVLVFGMMLYVDTGCLLGFVVAILQLVCTAINVDLSRCDSDKRLLNSSPVQEGLPDRKLDYQML